MTVAQTSLEAYTDLFLSGRLGHQQKLVLAVLADATDQGRALNNRMIAERARLPINCVTPRVKELREAGLVVCAGVARDPVTGKATKCWRAVV